MFAGSLQLTDAQDGREIDGYKPVDLELLSDFCVVRKCTSKFSASKSAGPPKTLITSTSCSHINSIFTFAYIVAIVISFNYKIYIYIYSCSLQLVPCILSLIFAPPLT